MLHFNSIIYIFVVDIVVLLFATQIFVTPSDSFSFKHLDNCNMEVASKNVI